MTQSLFITDSEAAILKKAALEEKNTLFAKSFAKLKDKADKALQTPIIVPNNGIAGGYEHTTHMHNASMVQDLGNVYKILGDVKYAEQATKILQKYVEVYPTLDLAESSTENPPGRLFHQILNDQMWLIRVVEGYSYLKKHIPVDLQKEIEEKVLIPTCELMITDNPDRFDIIHNHGIWAVASVAIAGIVMGQDKYIAPALTGLKQDGKRGFLAQLTRLYSPDGYYEEGPYYSRFALWPMFLFAEALDRHLPEYDIYNFRDCIIKKALTCLIDLSLPNGRLPSLNDAYKATGIHITEGPCIGFLYSVALSFKQRPDNKKLLWLAKKQDVVMINIAGYQLSKALAEATDINDLSVSSKEIVAGKNGDQGAIGILRNTTKDGKIFTTIMSYGSHGMKEHGHFDALSLNIYDHEEEILTDYGCARWANMEEKSGGCYTAENYSYAKHSIAHNTVVVDKATHHFSDGKRAERLHCKKHIFDASDPNFQIMSACADGYYLDTNMQRTCAVLVDDEFENPLIIDIFRLDSQNDHTYDLPFHYIGQPIHYDFPAACSNTVCRPLGSAFGYQHLWQEGHGNPRVKFSYTWLNKEQFYTVSSAVTNNTQVLWGKIGSNDPSANLRNEPYFIIRQTGRDHIFANILETHGHFNEGAEICTNSSPTIKRVSVLAYNEQGKVIQFTTKNRSTFTLMVSNLQNPANLEHNVMSIRNRLYSWTGSYKLVKKTS